MMYLFVGIIVGAVFERFLSPVFEMCVELFGKKVSIKATEYEITAKQEAFEFMREYPESNGEYRELSPVIGFQYQGVQDELEYEEEEY